MKTETHQITVNAKHKISSCWNIPVHYQAILIIAHGAGNDMQSDFISYLHDGFAEHDILTIKFNFPYKEEGRKSPDRNAVLEASWQAMIASALQKTQCSPQQIFLSGKSMGARVAASVAAQHQEIGGVICFGYPLHSPGKPENAKIDNLVSLSCPLLIIQGSRDALCDLDTLNILITNLPSQPTLHLIIGGDHSFRVLKSLNRSIHEVWRDVLQAGVTWIKQQG